MQPVSNAPSIRLRIALITLACIVPMAVTTAFLLIHTYQRDRERMTQAALDMRRAMAVALEQELSSKEAALAVLGATDLLANRDFEKFHRRAGLVLKDMQVQSITLLEPRGQLLVSTASAFGTPLPSMHETPLMKQIIRTGQGGVSNLFVGPISKRKVVAVGVPVRIDNRIAYTLNAALLPEQFNAILNKQNFRDTWRASILDADGHVVARSHDIDKFIGSRVSSSLLERIAAGRDMVFESRTLDGVAVLTALSRTPRYQWAIVLGIPLDELTDGLYATLWKLTGLTILLGAACLWFANRISRRIGDSMHALLAPAQALGSARIGAAPPLHFREAQEFFDSLVKAEQALQEARFAAHHDPLTRLANSTLFHDVVTQQLLLCRESGTNLVLLFIDLDGFKGVNDRYGHPVGDQVLGMAAERITSSCRDSDFAARLGGDEFAVALIHADLASAGEFSGRLIEKISGAYQVGDLCIDSVSASIGVATMGDGRATVEELLQLADQAMYQAKLQGKGRYVYAGSLA